MPDMQTTIKLINTDVDVTVTWNLQGRGEDAYPEIEQVTSDVLGDITDRVLNSVIPEEFTVGAVVDKGWQDPIRTALFGQLTHFRAKDERLKPWAQAGSPHAPPWMRDYVGQHMPVRVQFGGRGTLLEQIDERIQQTEAWTDALYGQEQDWE